MQPTATSTAALPESTTSDASVQRLARLLSSLREVKNVWRDLTRVAFPGGVSGPGMLNLVHREGASRVSDLAACAAALERARGRMLKRLAPALDTLTDDELAELERQLTRLAHDRAAVTRQADERTA